MTTHYALVQLDDDAEALAEELKREEGLSLYEAPRRALEMLSEVARYAAEWDAQASRHVAGRA